MMRTITAVLGLAAGLATFAAAGPASAIHVSLTPGGSGIVSPGEPIVITAIVDTDELADGTFTHEYFFGVDLPGGGPGGVSATPNFLEVGPQGFDDFEGFLTGPNITGRLDLERDEAAELPRINRIAAMFAAVDTGGTTPYTLTIMGSLLNNATVGNYTGNIAVVPLPGAAVLFLTALGGLAFFRRRRAGASAQAAAA